MYNSAVLLLAQAARTYPDNIAIEDSKHAITYKEYNRAALSIGTRIAEGGPRCAPVAVLLPKSHKSLVSYMGILYSGNIYVPLDEKMPAIRLEKILSDLRPAFTITDTALRKTLVAAGYAEDRILLYDDIIAHPADESKIESLVGEVIDTDPIYVIYTSGSTGVPKGVVVTHRGVLDYANWLVNTFEMNSASVFGNQSPFYFDNSILDIYACAATGAKLVVIPEELFLFSDRLPAYLAEKGVDTIFWVPTALINVANSGILDEKTGEVALPALKQILFCGEVMPNKQLNVWRRRFPHALFANLYGPAEITDVCTYYIVDRDFADSDPLPIGRACKNAAVLILTEDDKLAAENEIGELCVRGSGLALGYWNNPEQTGKVFINNPLNGRYMDRIYRTGDLAYKDAEGLIMCLGRKDSQIKHKGNRIELGEIEVAAKSIAGIDNACVLYDTNAQCIVLFMETAASTLTERQVNRELFKQLPKYMLPEKVVAMEALPYNANGKIDRVKLKSMLLEVS